MTHIKRYLDVSTEVFKKTGSSLLDVDSKLMSLKLSCFGDGIFK